MTDQLDSRALEVASQALGTVQTLGEEFRNGLQQHIDNDEARFNEISSKVSDGFKGIYNRMWFAVIAVVGGLGAVVLLLIDKVIP